MSNLPLTRDERTNDRSGTPHGLMGMADDEGNLLWLDELPAEQEPNVLVEYPVGPEFVRLRGYQRFVRFRDPVSNKQYALIKATKPD